MRKFFFFQQATLWTFFSQLHLLYNSFEINSCSQFLNLLRWNSLEKSQESLRIPVNHSNVSQVERKEFRLTKDFRKWILYLQRVWIQELLIKDVNLINLRKMPELRSNVNSFWQNTKPMFWQFSRRQLYCLRKLFYLLK